MLWRPRKSPVGFIQACLPSAAAPPPAGQNWIHEINTWLTGWSTR